MNAVSFQITSYQNTQEEDNEIISLLNRVFVGEGYTEKPVAEKMFVVSDLRKHGEMLLARSDEKILGMIICVPSTSSARQVARNGEAEIHLLAVYPEARGRGIATSLLLACEKLAVSSGHSKMVLSTQKTMQAAHRLYEKHGYYRDSSRDWKRGNDKIFYVYEKSLKIK